MTGNFKIRACTLNCKGLRNKWKRLSIFKTLKGRKLDIICLQEAHINRKDIRVWGKQWGGQIFYNEGSNRSKGEVILVSKHMLGERELIHNEDRIIVIKIEYQNKPTYIINAYAPNEADEKKRFYGKVKNIIDRYNADNIILCGDFNCVASNKLDIITGNPHNEEVIAHFLKMSDSLTDAWRYMHGEDKDYTWSRPNPFIARRLDYCFISQDLLNSCVSVEHMCIPSSDHKAVIMELNDNDFKRGPGYWRFNNSLLKQTEFVNKMNNKLEELTEEYANNPAKIQTWELVKVEIRNLSIDFGKHLACNRRNEEINLRGKLREVEQQLIREPEKEQYQTTLVTLKKKLEIIELEKAKGAQCRSRTKWIEEAEKNTSYFCSFVEK